jgi:hypothetical protein
MSLFPEIFGYDEINRRERRHELGCEFDRSRRLDIEERYQQNIQDELQRFIEEQRRLKDQYHLEHSRITKQLTEDRDHLVQNHIDHSNGDAHLVWETNTAHSLQAVQKQAATSFAAIQSDILNEMAQSRQRHRTRMGAAIKDYMLQLDNLNLDLATAQWMVLEVPIVPEEPKWNAGSATMARKLRQEKLHLRAKQASESGSTGSFTLGRFTRQLSDDIILDSKVDGVSNLRLTMEELGNTLKGNLDQTRVGPSLTITGVELEKLNLKEIERAEGADDGEDDGEYDDAEDGENDGEDEEEDEEEEDEDEDEGDDGASSETGSSIEKPTKGIDSHVVVLEPQQESEENSAQDMSSISRFQQVLGLRKCPRVIFSDLSLAEDGYVKI